MQEASRFAEFLSRYSKSFGHENVVPKDLFGSLYAHSKDCECLRLFYAFLDIEIVWTLLLRDAGVPGGLWNSVLSEHHSVNTVLNDYSTFQTRMNILDSFNSMALRLRACWDKYLAILVLLFEADQYDDFNSSSSRKRKFRKLAEGWTGRISPHIVRAITTVTRNWVVYATRNVRTDSCTSDVEKSHIDDLLDDLSRNNLDYPEPAIGQMLSHIEVVDRIRTAEAHGPGVLRKWSLSSLPPGASRDFSLYNYWNDFLHYRAGLHRTLYFMVSKP